MAFRRFRDGRLAEQGKNPAAIMGLGKPGNHEPNTRGRRERSRMDPGGLFKSRLGQTAKETDTPFPF